MTSNFSSKKYFDRFMEKIFDFLRLKSLKKHNSRKNRFSLRVIICDLK